MVPLKATAVDLYALTLLGGIDLNARSRILGAYSNVFGYLECLVKTILHKFLYTDHHLCFEGFLVLGYTQLCFIRIWQKIC